jgi:hypothetical protein
MKEDYKIEDKSAVLTWSWESLHNRAGREAMEGEGNKC